MKITIPVEEITGTLVLRQHIAEGHCEGYEFDYCVFLPGHGPLIEVNNRKFAIAVKDIVQAVVAEMIKETE